MQVQVKEKKELDRFHNMNLNILYIHHFHGQHQESEVLNLIDRKLQMKCNEIKEVIKDECEKRFDKNKENKTNWMSEQTMEIATKRSQSHEKQKSQKGT